MTRLLFALCLAVTIAPGAFTRPVHAEGAPERAARRHYDRGKKLFDLQKFQAALEEFQKAYDAESIPDFLFNIGQCQRNLGDLQAAVFSYKKFLKADPEAPNRELVEQLIADLEHEIAVEDSNRLGLTARPRVEPPPPRTPIYRKWWFWTGVAAVAAGAGVGIYAVASGGPPDTSLGHNVVFPK